MYSEAFVLIGFRYRLEQIHMIFTEKTMRLVGRKNEK